MNIFHVIGSFFSLMCFREINRQTCQLGHEIYSTSFQIIEVVVDFNPEERERIRYF